MTALQLNSEKFSPSGGFAADGIRKLLGSPALSLLQTVVRETVQNSWDARATGAITYRIELRTLTKQERTVLVEQIFAETPTSAVSLREFLAGPAPVVMEISDWGTRGLGGPTRADVVAEHGEPTDFVNFVRNIGMRRDSPQGGGTYGYGKSSLYSVSGCSTVIVDSLTQKNGTEERRLIACHLGGAQDDPKAGRLTGRHWWGVDDGTGSFVEPLRGAAAAALAEAVGLPERRTGQAGTTIMVLDPLLGGALDDGIGEIQESLLWFFWPKMLDDYGQRAITFETRLERSPVPVPAPEQFAPLGLFVEAYKTLKSRGEGTTDIRSERPARHLGRCVIRQGLKGERTRVVPAAESIIPAASRHIALMRPVELVVKYIEGVPLPGEDVEWAGVFICSTDAEVEQAFADAEPPAHDDWVPDKLPKGQPKTFVNVALKRLRELASTFAYPTSEIPAGDEEQPSLAVAADLLGRLLPRVGEAETSAQTRSGSRRGWKVSAPRFVGLRLLDQVAQATFEVDVENHTDRQLTIRGIPGYYIDGAISTETVAADGKSVRLLGWEDQSGAPRAGDTFIAGARSGQTMTARVLMPGLGAVGLRIEAQPEADQ